MRAKGWKVVIVKLQNEMRGVHAERGTGGRVLEFYGWMRLCDHCSP